MIRHLRCARRRFISYGCVALLLLSCTGYLVAAPHTIVIDAGHGGFDRGGIPGQRVAEKTMALDVAQRVAKKLRTAGYRVIMTRDSDVFVTLGNRVAVANSLRDSEFVCIHFNSATRAGANGIETYYYRSDSAGLAANIHRQVVSQTTSDNRGIRQRGFYVLRKTSVPSVLVECGFLTNPTEANLVLQSSYRERLAQGIADGVRGRPNPPNRPVLSEITHVSSSYAGSYNDFVSSTPERPTVTHHSSKRSSRDHNRSSSKKKHSSSSKKKKKSSDD